MSSWCSCCWPSRSCSWPTWTSGSRWAGHFRPDLIKYGFGLLFLSVGFHLVLRWRAAYADPLMLPIATLLNGLGLVMIHRLDLAYGRTGSKLLEPKQLMWSALSVLIAAGVIVALRDHRQLRPVHLHCHGCRPGNAPAAAAAGHRSQHQRLTDLDRYRAFVAAAG